jgi:hypothetical protein
MACHAVQPRQMMQQQARLLPPPEWTDNHSKQHSLLKVAMVIETNGQPPELDAFS